MIKILICEDIERDKLHLHQLLDSFLQSNKISYKIDYLENFDVGSNLFLEYDLIFLDIELGDYNGIEIASKIRTYNRSSIIIITSSFKKYLIDGYKIEAKRYLIKPIDEKVFNMRCRVSYQLHLNNNTFFSIKRYLNIRFTIRICYT